MPDYSYFLTIGATIAASTGTAALAWVFSLSPRITKIESTISSDRELLEAKLDGLRDLIEAGFETTDNRFIRVERAMNGAFHRHVNDYREND